MRIISWNAKCWGVVNKKMLVKFFVRKSIVILFLVWGCNDKKINIVMLEEWKKG